MFRKQKNQEASLAMQTIPKWPFVILAMLVVIGGGVVAWILLAEPSTELADSNSAKQEQAAPTEDEVSNIAKTELFVDALKPLDVKLFREYSTIELQEDVFASDEEVYGYLLKILRDVDFNNCQQPTAEDGMTNIVCADARDKSGEKLVTFEHNQQSKITSMSYTGSSGEKTRLGDVQ